MGVAGMALRVVAILLIAYTAFDIRMHAIRVYGRVIHEVRARRLPRRRARARARERLGRGGPGGRARR